MADVQPLRGIRYVSETVGNLAQIVTPPFDVISPEAQARYYARHPLNVIRLELPQEQPGDTTLNNRYTRAAATFAEWRLHNILRQDETPRYYMYQQIFTHNGTRYTRTGLMARVRLEPWSAGVVLPHERTHSKPKDDRLKLLRACATNFSPIMALYDDPQSRIRRMLTPYAEHAEIKITDEVNEEHRLHPVTDANQVALIQNFFAERQLYIADGHHRYETALNYREEVWEQRKQLHPSDAVNFVLMALIDTDDPGFLVLPTHRLLFGLNPNTIDALSSENLAQYFTLHELSTAQSSEQVLHHLALAGEASPSLVISTPRQSWLLSLNEHGKQRMSRSGHSQAWNELDVAVVHTLVLEDLLGLSPADITSGTHIGYTHDAHEALQAVHTGKAQVAILLNAARVTQVSNVARADERMPQKSTYFYPKLISGLVMNPLW